ncbi:MAG TPA: hypothetical protein VHF51_03895 [Solirubrobacteraceae bacterium]|nr:hypothetical protein [Solirubrobacteraceae bacterium]
MAGNAAAVRPAYTDVANADSRVLEHDATIDTIIVPADSGSGAAGAQERRLIGRRRGSAVQACGHE